MPKIRTIKPEFWTDGAIISLSPLARLLFIGSWNFALCDQGHLADDPMRLKLQILPADNCDIGELLAEVIAAGRIRRINADGRSYLHIVRFTDHQRIETRWESRCPACASLNLAQPRASSREHAGTRGNSRKEGKGREGKGREGKVGEGDARESARVNHPGEVFDPDKEPSRYCPDHPRGTNEPCWACKAAKDVHTAWKTMAAARRKAAIEDCAMCDGNGLTHGDNPRRCTHIEGGTV